MLYLAENLTIIPHGGFGGELHEIIKTDYMPDVAQKGMRLVGLFVMGIRYNEHFALWELRWEPGVPSDSADCCSE
jgi:hypothetical protein